MLATQEADIRKPYQEIVYEILSRKYPTQNRAGTYLASVRPCVQTQVPLKKKKALKSKSVLPFKLANVMMADKNTTFHCLCETRKSFAIGHFVWSKYSLLSTRTIMISFSSVSSENIIS
jgi:hypothetical protein